METVPFSHQSAENRFTVWDTLSDYDRDSAEQLTISPEEQTAAKVRLKNKIVGALTTSDSVVFDAEDYPATESQYNRVISAAADGVLNIKAWNNLISHFDSPLKSRTSEEIYNDLKGDPRELQILARFANVGFNNYSQATPGDVEYFAKHYDSPLKFGAFTSIFMNTLKGITSEQDYHGYETAMNNFKHHFYGEQQDYAEAARELMDEGAELRRANSE
ncbi:hypothetical protein IJG29_00835 [Candidatus Saccharibacteria bacterium]|nr:hypothetical protein [Candidatus Saccharibacteria bacterium]